MEITRYTCQIMSAFHHQSCNAFSDMAGWHSESPITLCGKSCDFNYAISCVISSCSWICQTNRFSVCCFRFFFFFFFLRKFTSLAEKTFTSRCEGSHFLGWCFRQMSPSPPPPISFVIVQHMLMWFLNVREDIHESVSVETECVCVCVCMVVCLCFYVWVFTYISCVMSVCVYTCMFSQTCIVIIS